MEHMSIRLPFLGFTQNNMHPVVVSAAKIANVPRDLRYAKDVISKWSSWQFSQMFDSLDLSQWLGILQLFESFYTAKPSGFTVEALGTSSAPIQVVENGLLHIAYIVHFLFPHVIERLQSWIFKGMISEKWCSRLIWDLHLNRTPYYLRNSAEWQEYWCERWPSPQALEASKTWSVSHHFSFFKYFLHRFLEHLCCFRQGLSFHELLIFARSVRLAEQDCLPTVHYTWWIRRLKYYQVLVSSGDKNRDSLLNTESCGICPLAKGGTGHERAPSSILSSTSCLDAFERLSTSRSLSGLIR